jgi:hypothetical protein
VENVFESNKVKAEQNDLGLNNKNALDHTMLGKREEPEHESLPGSETLKRMRKAAERDQDYGQFKKESYLNEPLAQSALPGPQLKFKRRKVK